MQSFANGKSDRNRGWTTNQERPVSPYTTCLDVPVAREHEM